MTKFPEFLEQRFLDWQQKSGRRHSLNDFADYLGIKRPLLSLWLNGSRRPGPEKIRQLENILGFEVYDALDIPRPDTRLRYITDHWGETPSNVQREITKEIGKFTTEKAPEDK